MYKPGDIIAEKYQVERVLGQGGMGMVLAARHLHLGDLVAIKLVLPELVQQSEVMGRFGNEARVARMLKSQHAGKVLDIGVLPPQNTPFIVMEFLEGRDLARVVATDGPLPMSTAVDYVLQACVALAEAHSLGIIHRDIKPSNMFLTFGLDGHPIVKVLDFGIAKLATQSQPQLTHTRGMMGSALYASPEQLESAKNVDARSDIWSLGVSFFELLTGQFPFIGDDIAMIAVQVFSKPPKKLRALRPDMPAAFDAIMDRWLAKNRDERFQNISEVSQAIAPFGTTLSQSSLFTVLTINSRPQLTPITLPSASVSEPGVHQKTPPIVVDRDVPAMAPTAPMSQPQAAGTAPPSVGSTEVSLHTRRSLAMVIAIGAALALVAIVVLLVRQFSFASVPATPVASNTESASLRASTSAATTASAAAADSQAAISSTASAPISTAPTKASATVIEATTGTLTIATTPPASCTVNGVAKGKTPLTLTVPAGDYAIVCKAANAATGAQSVKVVAGKASAVNLSLAADTPKTSHTANCNPAVDICE